MSNECDCNYTANLVIDFAPSKTSELTNDSGFITSANVGNGTITIQQNGVTVDSFSVNQTANKTINLIGSGGGTGDHKQLINRDSANQHPISAITDLQTQLNGKQATISDLSTIRSGASAGATALQPNDNITQLTNNAGYINKDVNDLTYYTKTADLPSVPTKTSDLTNDSGFIDKNVNDLTNYTKTSSLSTVATSGSYNDLSNKPTIGNGTITVTQGGTTKGTFTVNQSGDATIALDAGGGSSTDVQINGTSITSEGVANIPFAAAGRAGVISPSANYYFQVNSNGNVFAGALTYSQYISSNVNAFISKSTLENVIAGTLTFANSATVTLQRFGTHKASEAITSITLAYPASFNNAFISEVQFTTSTGTITFAVDSGTVMKGDDCSNGTFTPVASATYSIIFAYNGTTKYGVVMKIS